MEPSTDSQPSSSSSSSSALLGKIPNKRVSFEIAQTQYFEQQRPRSDEGGSNLDDRWYTSQELTHSREETRLALQALQASTAEEIGGSNTQFCFRGIEKFRDVIAKVQTQRLVKESVLRQQRLSREATTDGDDKERIKACPEQLAILSRYLSQPSKEIAHRLALVSAQETLQDIEDDEGLSSIMRQRSVLESTPTRQAPSSGAFAWHSSTPSCSTVPPESPPSLLSPSSTRMHPRCIPLNEDEEACVKTKKARIELTSATPGSSSSVPRQVSE